MDPRESNSGGSFGNMVPSSNAMNGHSPELEFRGSQAVEVDPGEPNSGGSLGNMVPSSNAVSGHGPEIEYCRGSQAV